MYTLTCDSCQLNMKSQWSSHLVEDAKIFGWRFSQGTHTCWDCQRKEYLDYQQDRANAYLCEQQEKEYQNVND